MRSEAARAAFDAIQPALLEALAHSPDPRRAFLRWEELLTRLPSAINLFHLLEARPGAGQNDGCRASCVDWYGNSRPLFVGGRVFALMGYEIVEGAATEKRIVETRRVSFAPRPIEVSR